MFIYGNACDMVGDLRGLALKEFGANYLVNKEGDIVCHGRPAGLRASCRLNARSA